MSRSKGRPLDVTRTRAALAAFDRVGDQFDADPSALNIARLDEAREQVGVAFAADTADRNDANDVREFVQCLAGLTFVRRICAGVKP